MSRGNPQFKLNAKNNEKLIKIIFDCLPAANFRELTDKVNRVVPAPVSMATISGTVKKIRSASSDDPTKYGWTIPHTKRGANPDNTNTRLFAMKDDSGSDFFSEKDKNDRRHQNLIEGNDATFVQSLQQFLHQSAAFQMSFGYYRGRGSEIKKLQVRMILFVIEYLVTEIQKFFDIDRKEKEENEKRIRDIWEGDVRA